MRRLVRKWEGIGPDAEGVGFVFPISLMYSSLFVSLCLLVLLSLPSSMRYISTSFATDHTVEFIGTYVFDVLILQLISLLLVSFLACRLFLNSSWIGFALAITIALSLLICEYIVEVTILKPTFKFSRPEGVSSQPWSLSIITDLFYWLFPSFVDSTPSADQTSAPSGFVVRQTMLTVYAFVLLGQPKAAKLLRLSSRIVFYLFFLLFLLLIAYFRIYMRAHTLFDVAMGIGLGTLLAWAFLFFAFFFNVEVRQNIGKFSLPAATFAFVILLYGQDYEIWIYSTGIMFILMSVLYFGHNGTFRKTP